MNGGSQGFQGSQGHTGSPAGDHDLLVIDEVAALLRCSTKTVRRLIARGDLPARRIGSTRRIRIAAADVDRLLHPTGDSAAGDLDSFIDQATT